MLKIKDNIELKELEKFGFRNRGTELVLADEQFGGSQGRIVKHLLYARWKESI